MKDAFMSVSKSLASIVGFALLTAVAATTVYADVWQATAGAQSPDKGKQALAFLSNELWIHAGDSIRWTQATDEIHTVSFLKTGQIRPPLYAPFGTFVGCPGATPDGSSFDGSSCVTSGLLTTGGQTYTVHFPVAGNFKLVCLVHVRMTGAIHVLNAWEPLPHDQAFYDRQADNGRAELLSDAGGLEGRGNSAAQQSSAHGITAGIAAILSNGGGSLSVTVDRFVGGTPVVRVGDTVEWTNLSPVTPHTITFGKEPADPTPPSPGVTLDSDRVRHAIINSPADNMNSGLINIPNQETTGTPETALDLTRFRVTFTAPGTFNYICVLHDNLGMVGRIIVLP